MPSCSGEVCVRLGGRYLEAKLTMRSVSLKVEFRKAAGPGQLVVPVLEGMPQVSSLTIRADRQNGTDNTGLVFVGTQANRFNDLATGEEITFTAPGEGIINTRSIWIEFENTADEVVVSYLLAD